VLGNRLNADCPADDFATYGEIVTKTIATMVAATGTAENPNAHAEMVVQRLFPNILPYVIGTSAVFGFADWNGRSLIDKRARRYVFDRGEYAHPARHRAKNRSRPNRRQHSHTFQRPIEWLPPLNHRSQAKCLISRSALCDFETIEQFLELPTQDFAALESRSQSRSHKIRIS